MHAFCIQWQPYDKCHKQPAWYHTHCIRTCSINNLFVAGGQQRLTSLLHGWHSHAVELLATWPIIGIQHAQDTTHVAHAMKLCENMQSIAWKHLTAPGACNIYHSAP